MSDLNRITVDAVSQFSSNDQVCLALVGKYGKMYESNYKMTIIKSICFVNTLNDCSIQIPDHYTFKYTDDNGEHIINDSTNTIDVKGITSFFFTIKNQ